MPSSNSSCRLMMKALWILLHLYFGRFTILLIKITNKYESVIAATSSLHFMHPNQGF